MDFEQFNKAKIQAESKLMYQYWYNKCIENPGLILYKLPKQDKRPYEEWCQKAFHFKKQRWMYIMFTANFKPDVDKIEMYKVVKKALTKKWISNYIYRWEYRKLNENGEPIGIHIHFRVELKQEKYCYNCKREMYNTFKHVLGNESHLHHNYSNDTNSFVEYLKGYKLGKPKDMFEYDEELNKEMKL